MAADSNPTTWTDCDCPDDAAMRCAAVECPRHRVPMPTPADKTTGWQPIETAPQDYDGDPIMVAHFRDHDRLPVYAVMVSWASAMPGYTHCASYSGWFVHCLPTEDPPRRRGINVVSDEILARTEMAPTHWRPM